jgi:hypothetical protein
MVIALDGTLAHTRDAYGWCDCVTQTQCIAFNDCVMRKGDKLMKARTVSLMIVASLLFVAFAATPASAGAKTTDYTGTVDFVSWVNLAPPVVIPGGTTHELVITEWSFNTTDPRLLGTYVLAGTCTWPRGKLWPWGPCQTTWTLDVDNDQKAEWEGVLTLTPQDYHVFWNGNGHGLGRYAGLFVSFKVYSGGPVPPGTVVGYVIEK